MAPFGAFNPDLHPHGFHGHWAETGNVAQKIQSQLQGAQRALKPTIEIGSKGNRSRARAGSGLAYARGPAQRANPNQSGISHAPAQAPHGMLPAGTRPTVEGKLTPGSLVNLRIPRGNGAPHVGHGGPAVHVGKVISHKQTAGGVHTVKVSTSRGTHTLNLHPVKVHVNGRLSLHPTRTGSNLPRASAFVDHQAIQQWWAGRVSPRRTSPLPRKPLAPGTGQLGRPGRLKKDGEGAMTVTSDLGHDGQAPVTIMQGGSRLERCPQCGYKLSSDGQCPKHGNIIKSWRLAKMEEGDPTPPSTAEALAPTVTFPKGKKRKKPPVNQPDAPTCPDCGGADGYHAADCPRSVLNPGGGPTGLGAG